MVRTRSRGAHASSQRAPMRVTRTRGVRAGDRRGRESGVKRALPRSARVRLAAAGGVVVLLAVGLALGGGSPDVSPEPTVQTFLLNWENAHYKAAAGQTTGNQDTVAAALAGIYQQLGADDLSLGLGPISQRGDTATAGFNATFDLGPNGAAWTYRGQFALRRAGRRLEGGLAPVGDRARAAARAQAGRAEHRAAPGRAARRRRATR